jgi:hypothetical protein
MTNGDRIRAMSDEELADLINTGLGKMSYDCYHCIAGAFCSAADENDFCKAAWLQWLRQPAE